VRISRVLIEGCPLKFGKAAGWVAPLFSFLPCMRCGLTRPDLGAELESFCPLNDLVFLVVALF
jgi:hypothetical protein